MSVLIGDGSGSSSCATNCCHDLGSVPCIYPQVHNQFSQQHRGGRVDSSPRQLRSVDAPRAPRAQRHLQEDDLPYLRPNNDRILHRQITYRVIRNHQNVVHSRPSSKYSVCDSSQDRQVPIGDSRMFLHGNSPEDVGEVQKKSDSTPRTTRNIRPHRGRLQHAPRKHGVICGHRNAGGPAAGARPTRERYNCSGTY